MPVDVNSKPLKVRRLIFTLKHFNTASLTYRPEIDGLRAIAVLAVVLYHCGFNFVSGGFIGVDIFFVISGFLITSLLNKELLNGNFSLSVFYAKRIRRLYPALFFTILLTVVAGYFIFMPDEFKELGQSTVGVVTYLANVFFYLKSDYFDGPSNLKPLLHTWSLAVEEQFYIIFPLFLLVLAKLKKQIGFIFVTGLFLLSFAGSILFLKIDNSAAFFLTPFRAWEFMLGALCSVLMSYVPEGKAQKCGAIAYFGLLLIITSFIFINEETSFPGVNAFPVTLGTALLILFARQQPLLMRILANKAVVFTGKISYSTYLVHWPIIVYYHYAIMRVPTLLEQSGLVFASFGAGFLFYQLIENKFRLKSLTSKEVKTTFLGTLVATFFVCILGGVVHINEGFKDRFVIDNKNIKPTANILPPEGNCFLSTKESFEIWNGKSCFIGNYDKEKKTTLLWGDSHINHLVFGINAHKERIESNIIVFASAGCAPIFQEIPKSRPNCARNNAHLAEILEQFNVSKVVLASNWQYAKTQGVNIFRLRETIEKLYSRGLEISIINQLPVYPVNNPQYLKLRLSYSTEEISEWAIKPAKGKKEEQIIASMELPALVKVVNPFDIFCNEGACSIIKENKLMVEDAVHLSNKGSELMIDRILSKDKDFF